MLISVVNCSTRIKDAELLKVIRAINRQIAEDFEPYWSFGARLRLEGKIGKRQGNLKLHELRGDAILYIRDKASVKDALGYHDKNGDDIPYGFVFTELSEEQDEPWSVTLSHEALELLGDAQGNLLVEGPHPLDRRRRVFHWFEMCDAVQSQSYEVDGIAVSNFVLPQYFTPGDSPAQRNDFLGLGVRSFSAAEGSYIGFHDPAKRRNVTWFAPDDKAAKQRLARKKKARAGRAYLREHGDPTRPRVQAHRAALAKA